MGTFGGTLWGTGTGAQPQNIGTPLSELIMPAYRIAGVIELARIAPVAEMVAEGIPELNRMIGGWNCSRPNIFTISINTLPLTTALKYTVGPGADFDMPRPQAIQNGVLVLPNGVRVQPPMYQMDDSEWAQISLQTIPNSVSLAFYYDGSYDPATGWGLIYMWPQSQAGYSVDWYCWQALPTFQASTDQVALPPGYEDAIVYGLAERLIRLNPKSCGLDIAQREEVRSMARKTLKAIERLNAPTPKMTSDFPNGRPGTGHFDWRTGMVVR